jgi:hypothetical protein
VNVMQQVAQVASGAHLPKTTSFFAQRVHKMTGSFSMFAQNSRGPLKPTGSVRSACRNDAMHSFFSDNLERALQQGFVTGSMSRQGIGP